VNESDFLGRMAMSSSRRAAQAKSEMPEVELLRRAQELASPPSLAHDRDTFDVIAEIKLRSPSEGSLESTAERADGDGIGARAISYQRAGAAAISVLTEPSEFQGSLEHLAAAAAAVDVPVLRKDFLVDPYQVVEARVQGAGGVLLIARMLSGGLLGDMLDTARGLEMFALVEAFDAPDLHRIARLLERSAADHILPPVLVGLNCRDLTTLAVEPERFAALSGSFPPGFAAVAESGLHSLEDFARVAALGYDMALVGSALMREDDPADLLRRFIESGRRACEEGTRGLPDSRDARTEDTCESA